MAVYGNFILNENKENPTIRELVHKNQTKIKNFINKYSALFFEKEKSKQYKDEYDWRKEISKAPKFMNIEYTFIYKGPWIQLEYYKNCNFKYCTNFDAEFIKYLNKQNDEINDLFKFATSPGGAPGIVIYKKIKSP